MVGVSAYKNTFIASVAAAFLLCFGPSTVHAVSGMETALFTFLFTLFSYLIFEVVREPEKRKAAFVGITALALGCTRPEGNLITAIGLLATFCLVPRSHRLQILKATILFYVLPGALYFAWRFHFYGQLMPLPFYLKVGNQTGLAGIRDVRGYLREIYSLIEMLLFCGGLFLAFNKQRAAIPIILSMGAFLLFFLAPAHIMGYQWRYLFPLTPLLFLLAALGFSVFLRAFDVMGARQFAMPALAMFVLLICLRMQPQAMDAIANLNEYRDGLASAHRVLGIQLGTLKTRGVLAIGDAGAVPYFSGWKTIDTFGLNNQHIALHGHDASYVLSHKPDLIVLISNSETEFMPPLTHEKQLYETAVRTGFSKTQILRFNPSYFLWVMTKPDDKSTHISSQRAQ